MSRVLRCPYWVSLMGDKEWISIYHHSMCIIYPFKEWSLTLLLTSWLQYQMFETKKAPRAVPSMQRRRRRNLPFYWFPFLFARYKTKHVQLFSRLSYPSRRVSPLSYLSLSFLFLFLFPSLVYVHSWGKCIKRFIRRAMPMMMRTARITTTLIAQCIVYQANHLSDKKTYFNLK